jgi:excisionase family DNA binding protein
MSQSVSDSLDVAGAARDLKTSKKFIRDRIKDGTLPAFRIGGSRLIRILRSDLEAFKQPVNEPVDEIDEYLEKLVGSAPKLSPAQRDRIAALIGEVA